MPLSYLAPSVFGDGVVGGGGGSGSSLTPQYSDPFAYQRPLERMPSGSPVEAARVPKPMMQYPAESYYKGTRPWGSGEGGSGSGGGGGRDAVAAISAGLNDRHLRLLSLISNS